MRRRNRRCGSPPRLRPKSSAGICTLRGRRSARVSHASWRAPPCSRLTSVLGELPGCRPSGEARRRRLVGGVSAHLVSRTALLGRSTAAPCVPGAVGLFELDVGCVPVSTGPSRAAARASAASGARTMADFPHGRTSMAGSRRLPAGWRAARAAGTASLCRTAQQSSRARGGDLGLQHVAGRRRWLRHVLCDFGIVVANLRVRGPAGGRTSRFLTGSADGGSFDVLSKVWAAIRRTLSNVPLRYRVASLSLADASGAADALPLMRPLCSMPAADDKSARAPPYRSRAGRRR